MTVAVHLGGSVGFYSGNVQELLDDVLVSQWLHRVALFCTFCGLFSVCWRVSGVCSVSGLGQVLDAGCQTHQLSAASAQVYERDSMTVAVRLGGNVCFYSGTASMSVSWLKTLLSCMFSFLSWLSCSDLKALKPNIFVSVPRLWNRIYYRVMVKSILLTCRPLCSFAFCCDYLLLLQAPKPNIVVSAPPPLDHLLLCTVSLPAWLIR